MFKEETYVPLGFAAELAGFILGEYKKNSFTAGYAWDISIPFTWYFMAKAFTPPEKTGKLSTAIAATVPAMICSTLEFAQKFGYYPGTYDPKDFLAYGAGAAAALAADFVISKFAKSMPKLADSFSQAVY